jgi:myosin heavy subunit
MTVPLSKQQSFDASMALIKTIYGLAFIWLVDMANTIIAPTGNVLAYFLN